MRNTCALRSLPACFRSSKNRQNLPHDLQKTLENKPGALAETLAPLAQAGADLQVVMAYPNPAGAGARVEVHPVSGKKSMDAAKSVQMAASPVQILVVQGDNRTGLGHDIAQSISEAGINVGFVMAQVIGRKYAAVLGFENDADATKAMGLIKKASAPARTARRFRP